MPDPGGVDSDLDPTLKKVDPGPTVKQKVKTGAGSKNHSNPTRSESATLVLTSFLPQLYELYIQETIANYK